MSAYTVTVNVSIIEAVDREGSPLAPHTYLAYSTKFSVEGETLTDIAPQIDRIIAAMQTEGVTGAPL